MCIDFWIFVGGLQRLIVSICLGGLRGLIVSVLCGGSSGFDRLVWVSAGFDGLDIFCGVSRF